MRELCQRPYFTPSVAGLVEIDLNAVASQVDDVSRAGAIDISQSDALLVELVGVVEQWRIVHGHLSTKASVAQVGPVTDLAVANAHQIGESIAGKVG